MTFEVEVGPKGKRERRVQPVRVKRPSPPPHHRNHPAQWGTATLFVIPAFIVLFGVVAVLWRTPMWVVWLYLGASVVTFLAYALDKSAAVRQAWRTKESTLHLLALVGGWPGALLAQQVLRHKSTKQEFRQVFWGTVTLNLVALLLLATPARTLLLRAL